MIRKGTKVEIRTTNGGHTFATLLEDYRPTYHVVIDRPNNGYAIIEPERIKSLVPA